MKAIEKLTARTPVSQFKQNFTAQERWKKHLGIVKGSSEHVSIIVEKLRGSGIKTKKPYIL